MVRVTGRLIMSTMDIWDRRRNLVTREVGVIMFEMDKVIMISWGVRIVTRWRSKECGICRKGVLHGCSICRRAVLHGGIMRDIVGDGLRKATACQYSSQTKPQKHEHCFWPFFGFELAAQGPQE
jgi:hypothetical protein